MNQQKSRTKAPVLWRSDLGGYDVDGLLGIPVSSCDSGQRNGVISENTVTDLINDVRNVHSLEAEISCFLTASLADDTTSFGDGLCRASTWQGSSWTNFRMGDVTPLFRPMRGVEPRRFGGQYSSTHLSCPGAALRSASLHGSRRVRTSGALEDCKHLENNLIPTNLYGGGMLRNSNQMPTYSSVDSYRPSQFPRSPPVNGGEYSGPEPAIRSSAPFDVNGSYTSPYEDIAADFSGFDSPMTVITGSGIPNPAQLSGGRSCGSNGVRNLDDGLSTGTAVDLQTPGSGLLAGPRRGSPHRDVSCDQGTPLNRCRGNTRNPFGFARSLSPASGIVELANTVSAAYRADNEIEDRLAVATVVMAARSRSEHFGNACEDFLAGVERRPSNRLLLYRTNIFSMITRFQSICATQTRTMSNGISCDQCRKKFLMTVQIVTSCMCEQSIIG